MAENSAPPKPEVKDPSPQGSANGAPTSVPGAPEGEKKLSAKELKLRKAAEKQARRAQQKGLSGGPPPAAADNASPNQQLNQNQNQRPAQGRPNQQSEQPPNPSTNAGKQDGPLDATLTGKAMAKTKPGAKLQVPLFAHLAQTRRFTIDGSSKDVHPAVLSVGLQMSRYEVCGSTARCLAMLLAFKEVVDSYITPSGHHISRHFSPHVLSHQIDYLRQCRPISISMGNAIRWVKDLVAKIDPDMQELDAKTYIIDSIDVFIRERIQAADALIATEASKRIEDGDTILTYAKSSLVLKTLLAAKSNNKSFKVIIIDSKPLFEGRSLARDLTAAGFKDVEYALLPAVAHTKATKVILGAHALMSNGRLFARCGTSLVAMTANAQEIPVIVCCESLKFADKAPLDSILFNETAPPLDLLTPGTDKKRWEENPNLHMLNLMFDVTPAEYLTSIYTEYGTLPPSSVPAILRLLEDVAK